MFLSQAHVLVLGFVGFLATSEVAPKAECDECNEPGETTSLLAQRAISTQALAPHKCVPMRAWVQFQNIMQPYNSNHSEIFKLGLSAGMQWKSLADVDDWLKEWQNPCPEYPMAAAKGGPMPAAKKAPVAAAYKGDVKVQEIQFNKFKDIADGMGKVKWDKLQWGDGKTEHLGYTGCMVQGLFYTVAFIESSSNGKVQWVDFAKSMGSVGATALSFIPTAGPILSGVLTFALALFGSSSPSMGDQIAAALQKLYEKIMTEVENMMQKQLVETAYVEADASMNALLDKLSTMPEDIAPPMHGMSEGEMAVLKAAYFNTIDGLMVKAKPEIFGSKVGCYTKGTINPDAPDSCKKFSQRGALYFQSHFVLLHLSVLSEWARSVPHQDSREGRLRVMRQRVAEYIPLLEQSLNLFLTFKTACDYEYPSCWGECKHERSYVPGTGMLPISCSQISDCGALRSGNPLATLKQNDWKDNQILDLTLCLPTASGKGQAKSDRNLCDREGGVGKPCSNKDFQQYWSAYAKYVHEHFDPLLDQLRKLKEPIQDPAGLVESLVANPVKEAPEDNKHVDTTMCTSACSSLEHSVRESNANIPEFLRPYLSVQEHIIDGITQSCRATLCNSDVKTRKDCKDAINSLPIPSINGLADLSSWFMGLCNSYPLF